MGTVDAVVPVRGLPAGKTRLAQHLNVDQRNRLVRAMLADVIAALVGTSSINRVTIFSQDAAARREAEHLGIEFLQQPSQYQGLNAGLAYAQTQRAEVAALLIVPADLPLITPEDVEALLAAQSVSPGVGIAPSVDGGTNGLYVAPPLAIRPAFGRDSARRHARAAKEVGARVASLESPRWALDVDWPEDFGRVLALATGHPSGDRLQTVRCLRAKDFPAGGLLPAL